jgi:hypothetical protein
LLYFFVERCDEERGLLLIDGDLLADCYHHGFLLVEVVLSENILT